MDKSLVRMKQLKRQLEEVEEQNSHSNAQRRKLQRELGELTDSGQSMTREITSLRNQLRYGRVCWSVGMCVCVCVFCSIFILLLSIYKPSINLL